jgi:uncharacterized membrane protein
VKKYAGWLSVIILAALGVRLYNLDYHSLWFDEAISVYWARQSVARILEVGFTLVEDRLPPLYYLMLKGWITLFGPGEVAVRMLSVAFGVLLVPVIAGIAALLFNRKVALTVAALVALNPFLIWYAQEARMYAPAAFCGALAVWAFLQFCRNYARSPASSWKFVLLFILAAAAGLYSHLYTAFLLPALGLWLLAGYPQRWQLWLIFMAAGLIIILSFSPIALAIWRFSAEAPPGDPFTGLLDRAWWLLHAFTVWKAPLAPWLQRLIPLTVALFALLAFLPAKHRRADFNPPRRSTDFNPHTYSASTPFRYPRLLIVLLCLMPFLIANLLLLRNQLAFFGERYFIIMLPWLLLLAALGLYRLTTWLPSLRIAYCVRLRWIIILRVALYALLFTSVLLPLPGQWSVPAAKEAWRQSVAYLARHAAPDDAILIHPDWVRYPFQYYFQGPGQTYAAFSTVTPKTALDGPLQGVIGDHPVVWLVQSHLDAPDPNRRVEGWLAARYPLVTELYPPGIALKGYAPGYQLETLPPAATPVDFRFDNGLRLAGYQADPHVSATDELFHPPSGWVHVTLYWVADGPVTIERLPFVHLVGPEGVWGISLDRASDALKFYPPSRWEAGNGQIIRHDLDVNLNPATPPGTYQLVVGLQGEDTQYPIGQVEVR